MHHHFPISNKEPHATYVLGRRWHVECQLSGRTKAYPWTYCACASAMHVRYNSFLACMRHQVYFR
jgi:hypothetical protein